MYVFDFHTLSNDHSVGRLHNAKHILSLKRSIEKTQMVIIVSRQCSLPPSTCISRFYGLICYWTPERGVPSPEHFCPEIVCRDVFFVLFLFAKSTGLFLHVTVTNSMFQIYNWSTSIGYPDLPCWFMRFLSSLLLLLSSSGRLNFSMLKTQSR